MPSGVEEMDNMRMTAARISWFVAVLVASCSQSAAPRTSSSSNWLECSTLADCAGEPTAVACTQGYCVNSSGQRLVKKRDGDAGRSTAGAPDASASDSGSTAGARDSGSGGSAVCSALANGADAATLAGLLDGNAASCTLHASDYDRSCSQDADCIAVGEGDVCSLSCVAVCPSTAINARDEARYRADFANTPIGSCHVPICRCPCVGFPRCHNGACELVSCAAAMDAGL